MSESKKPVKLRSMEDEDDTPVLPSRPTTTTLPPPPMMIHSTNPIVPTMESAPPSGNLSLPLPPPPKLGLPRPPTMTATVALDLPPPPTMSAVSRDPSSPPTIPQDDHSMEVVTEPDPLPLTAFAPKSHSFLAKRQTHLPILLVATESANRVAWKNKLRLADMFEGLSQDLSSVESGHPIAPFRSVTQHVRLKWDDLQLCFQQPSQMVESSDSQELLQQHAALQETDGNLHEELDLLEEQVDKLLQDGEDDSGISFMEHNRQRQTQLEKVVRDAYALTSPPNIPWLWRFRMALDESTNYLEHDLIQQPPICLLICSSEEHANLEACFSDLVNPYNLPQEFYGTNKLWDPTTLKKEVVVLHDTVDGPKDLDLDLMEIQLKQKYGATAAVLRINSIVPSMAKALEAEETSDLWDGNGKRGNCLSSSDRLVLRGYLAHLVTASVLPAMERRISDLNHIVTERKKGVRNVFRGLFRPARATTGGKDPSEEKSTNEGGHYRYDSVESQVRLLADSLFLIKDYEAALSMYKLIRDDYKNDRAMLHYASVQEMMALCVHMMDPHGRSKDVFQYLETALFNYTRAAEDERGSSGTTARPTTAPKPTRLATRLCLVLSAAKSIKSPERHLEVADLLASASSHETSLGAAVLLEQSSAHYYKAGMYRKYAFHMLMSGHMFRSAQQEHHAFRCFTSALYIYHDGQWDELHNHLRSALAAQLYSLGRMAISVELYAKLVGTTGGGRVSVKSQQKFVNHLLEICKDHTKKALVGADRMVGDPSGRTRHDRFDRIEEVIRGTRGATRVLELPNVDLPSLDDSTVTIQVEAEARNDNKVIHSLGKTAKGEDRIWEELQCQTVAELRAADPAVPKLNDDDLSLALASILDPDIRAMIAEIEKEKTNLNLTARAKKSGSVKPQPAARARMEPLVVEFEMKNPLAVKVTMKEMQLVAHMKEKGTDRLCTNEDAIAIGATSSKTWTFSSSASTFLTPDFCRLAPVGTSKSWKSAAEEEPFFVVTKKDTTLESGGKAKVALSICPLAKGDLEILGVRCKLFDDVWIYHPFKIKGKLLQNTQDNRATRARAEQMLLKSKVEDDMPRLTATLLSSQSEDSGQVIQGEISSWTLRVSNIGTAPASNLTLKTNVPWMNINSSSRLGDHPEREASSRCVGASGTLLKLPLEGLAREGVILPGEEVDIPVALRTVGGAQQDFYMLFRYDVTEAAKVTHRWLRQMIDVAIYPSLTFTATIMPSYWAKTEHVISVEVANYRSEIIFLDKLSVASREYRLEQMPGQLSDDSEVLQLDVHERATMHYRLVPISSSSSGCVMSECKFTGSEEGSSRQECVTSDSIDYLCLESSQSRFKKALRMYQADLLRGDDEDDQQPRHVSQIRRAKEILSEKGASTDNFETHPTSIARLFPLDKSKTKVDMICSWRTTLSTIDTTQGQHHIASLPVRPRTKSKGCPITITCQHPSSLIHNFSADGPVPVSFEVTVRNRLVDSAVDFEFSVERPKTFEFTGAESFAWNLDGGDELTIPLTAMIPVAGVYNLQKIRLTVVREDKSVPYLFPLQWMVSVNDSSKA